MRRPHLTHPLAARLTLAALAALAACGDHAGAPGSSSFVDAGRWADAESTGDAVGPTSPAPPADADATAGADAIAVDVPPPPDPEERVDFDLRTPEAGDSYLYIPSAGLDALVVVDAGRLRVHLVEVGVEPVLVRALPGDLGAVVLNAGSDDLAIVRPVAGGDFEVTAVSVQPDHNRLVISPDGAWAFAFFDHRGQATGARGSLSDVTAARLVAGEEVAYNLAVGYKPEDVRFADEDRLALILSEQGISGVYLEDLGGDGFLPAIPVDDRPFTAPVDREIAITPSGALAVARDLAAPAPELVLVDVFAQTRATLSLPDWPSDLALTPAGDRVVVPMKATEQVAIVDIPEAFAWTPPDDGDEGPADSSDNPYVTFVATGAPFGSSALTRDADRALLFTTAEGAAAIGMLDLDAATVVLQPLVKPVDGVAVAPDGRVAALRHRRGPGADASVRDTDGYSLLDLDSGYLKLVLTDRPATDFVFTDDADALFALMPAPPHGPHLVHRADTRSFAVTPYRTPHEPVYVGILAAANKVAVALDDPTGWITFIDTESGAVDQVNSFELNSLIR